MAFFGNSAVNRVNLHYAIEALATGAGGVFLLAFLLHAGLSVPATLLTMAGVLAGRFAMRPIILPIGKRWGLKPLVIAGALVIAAQYPMLAGVHGLNVWLYLFAATSALGDTLYWPSYHAYFASLGDAEHRGHQIGAREAVAAGVGVIAPLLGAWALVTVGPMWAFAGVGLVQALSVVPLIGAPNVRVVAHAPGALRAAWLGLWLFVSDGWLAASFYFVWQIVLFLSLGRSLAAYGGAMALAALAGAVAGMVLGRHIDLGHGRRSAALAYAATGLVSLLRAASLGSPWLAVASNALGAFVVALVVPAMMSAVYNLAKASPCAFRFHIASEGGWDAGCIAGCLLGAGLAATGQSLAFALLASLLGVGASAWLLWRYYGAHPESEELETPTVIPGAPQPP